MKKKIQLTESQLNNIIKESVRTVINEGMADDSPITKWVYWCFNFHNPEEWMDIFEGANPEYFMDKFRACKGDMNRFFVELDSTNQQKLIDYVMNNY